METKQTQSYEARYLGKGYGWHVIEWTWGGRGIQRPVARNVSGPWTTLEQAEAKARELGSA